MTNSIETVRVLKKAQDTLRRQIIDLLREPSEQLKTAKSNWHEAKILTNQLQKDIAEIQACILLEQEKELLNQQQVEDAWKYKSDTELNNQNGI